VVDVGDGPSIEQANSYENSDHAVDFGEVRYLQNKTASLTLANTGRVPAKLLFVEKLEEEEEENDFKIPTWLTASFTRSHTGRDAGDGGDLGNEATLEPGETAQALLDVYIDDISLVRMLNDGRVELDEVLVLRITDGRDHFIPIRATWSPTIIGRSIEELVRIPDGGIKAFLQSRISKNGQALVGSIPYDFEAHYAAPKALFKLTEAAECLTERVLADEQMLEGFNIPKDAGWPFEQAAWTFTDEESRSLQRVNTLEAIDYDKPILDSFSADISLVHRLEIVSEVLLIFLQGLTDGVITMPLWARIEQTTLPSVGLGGITSRQLSEQALEDDKSAILDILATAPNHNVSFVFLTTTIAKIVAELTPLGKTDLDGPYKGKRGMSGFGRRSLSLRRSTNEAEAAAALERRQAKERKFAQIFGDVVCRTPVTESEKERKNIEGCQRAVLELFLRRRDDG
jgi:hypothetical protein